MRAWTSRLLFLALLALGACGEGRDTERAESIVPEAWEGYGSQTVMLFFAEGGAYPVWREEPRVIELQEDPADRVARCLEELFRGPEQAEGRAFPPGMRLEHLFLEEGAGVLTLDFDPMAAQLVTRAGSVEERIALEALRRTLRVNFPEIRRLRILVGGQTPDSFGGHLKISTPLVLREQES